MVYIRLWTYGACHKKLYEIRRLSASEIRSFFRGNAEDIRGIVQGCPRNRARVPTESCKGVRRIMKGCLRNLERVLAES